MTNPDPGPLKVALVGYGYWGPNLMRNYSEHPDTVVSWVCDTRPEALRKVEIRYPGVPVTSDYAEVLTDPGAAVQRLATLLTSPEARANVRVATVGFLDGLPTDGSEVILHLLRRHRAA